MARKSVEVITCALDEFCSTDDNDYRLNEILENFGSVENHERALPSMFALLERFPDADFGSPGSLVHTIESIPGYRELLKESLSRLPTVYTVWMVNRILNGITDGEEWLRWMRVLEKTLAHPMASEGVRENVQHFINYQNERIET